MPETIGIPLLFAGLAGSLVAWAWLLLVAFRCSTAWGLVLFFLPPLAILFLIRHPQPARRPLTLLAASTVVSAMPFAYSAIHDWVIGRPAWIKTVDGETHVTLTGWDRDDYSQLARYPDVVVVQMANPDVTDDTLAILRGLPQLRELDLNDTRITDAGLAVLAELPNLAVLRVRNTRITDDGFREHLFDKPLLTDLDLRGTGVKGKTVREWKAAREGRRVLQ